MSFHHHYSSMSHDPSFYYADLLLKKYFKCWKLLCCVIFLWKLWCIF